MMQNVLNGSAASSFVMLSLSKHESNPEAARRSGRVPSCAQVFSAALISRCAVTHIRPESEHGVMAEVGGRTQGALLPLRCEKIGNEKTC